MEQRPMQFEQIVTQANQRPAAAYMPALAGSEYGRRPFAICFRYHRGVRFVENYSGIDDMVRLFLGTFGQRGPGGVEAVKRFNERVRPSGTHFSYASGQTQVLGLVLRNAIG
jgi:hypothetical protein